MFPHPLCAVQQPETNGDWTPAAMLYSELTGFFYILISLERKPRTARTRLQEKDSWYRTARKGQLGQDNQNKKAGQTRTSKGVKTGHDSQDRTATAKTGFPHRTGWSEHDGKDRTGGTAALGTRVMGRDSRGRTAKTRQQQRTVGSGQPEHDSMDRTAGTG
jgi:hypothetical protein